jgi:hypothetical protein
MITPNVSTVMKNIQPTTEGVLCISISKKIIFKITGTKYSNKIDSIRRNIYSATQKFWDYFLIIELKKSKDYQPISVHTPSFVCLSSTVYELKLVLQSQFFIRTSWMTKMNRQFPRHFVSKPVYLRQKH